MTAGAAHSPSLHLFTALQRFDSREAWDAVDGLSKLISLLHLEEDIEPVLIISSSTSISIEPRSPFGEAIIGELEARSNFPPCPEGECETDGTGICKWCGAGR